MTDELRADSRVAPRLRRAHLAVFVVFAQAGVVFATWASRIPDAKDKLALTAGELGLTLLALSVGSVLGMPLTGRVRDRLGVTRTVRAGAVISAVGLMVLAWGIDGIESRWGMAAGLFLYGLGTGMWDVSMNLGGADVERQLGRTVMPHYHAAFSGGTVMAALVGAGLVAARVPIWVHLLVAVGLGVGCAIWMAGRFLPDEGEPAGGPLPEADPHAPAAEPAPGSGGVRSAWLEPRTLIIGFVVLAAAFTEGTANDWLAVAFVSGHHLPNWAGVLAFATFLVFMTAGRLLGTRLLDTHGRVLVLRVTFVTAAVGAMLVIFAPWWLAFVGVALWGVGASLGFPVGMSASADDPARASARMSVVATIGYVAFLAGPPLLGFLGDSVGVLRSLLVVAAVGAIVLLLVEATREPERR